MIANIGTNDYSLEWAAPATANPEGLLGGVFVRALGTENDPASELVRFSGDFGLDPAGRDFDFRGSANSARLRGTVVIETNPVNANDRQIGIAFSGTNLTNGATYTLTIATPGGAQRVVSLGQVAGGRGSILIGPEATTFPDEEDTFTYTVNGPEFNNLSSGPGDIEPPEFDGAPFTVTNPTSGWSLTVLNPLVEVINGTPGIELIGDSSAEEGDTVYAFVVELRDASGAIRTDMDVEWQLVLEGVAQDAVGDGQPAVNTLTFVGPGAGSASRYEFSVSGNITKSRAFGGTIQPNDSISADGRTATGRVTDTGRDSYDFTGRVTSLLLTGDRANLLLNGEAIDPQAFLPNVLTLESQPTGPASNYTFTVSGGLAKSNAFGGTTQPTDVISGNSATGRTVRGGRDSYAYGGSIERLEVDGAEPNIYINGNLVDRAQFLPNVVTIIGPADRGATYSFTAGRDVVKSTADGATINANDVITGNSVSGRVANGGQDSYAFSGGFQNFQTNQPASVAVILNGTQIRP